MKNKLLLIIASALILISFNSAYASEIISGVDYENITHWEGTDLDPKFDGPLAGAELLNYYALQFYLSSKSPWSIYYEQCALNIVRKKNKLNSPEVFKFKNNLASFYGGFNEHEKAIKLFEEIIENYKKKYRANDSTLAVYLRHLSYEYQQTGKYVEAVKSLELALSILEKQNKDTTYAIYELADNELYLGNYFKAEKNYLKAKISLHESAYLKAHSGPGDVTIGEAVIDYDLAKICNLSGRYSDAEKYLKKSMSLYGNEKYPDADLLRAPLESLALTYEAIGRKTEALETLTRAANLAEKKISELLTVYFEKWTDGKLRDELDQVNKQTSQIVSFHLQSAPNDKAAAALALNAILQRKGRILDASTIMSQALKTHLNPLEQNLLKDWIHDRTEKSELYYQRGERNTEQLIKTSSKIESIENQFGPQIKYFINSQEKCTYDKIQKLLPKDAVLIEIILYQPFDPKATQIRKQVKPYRYAAYAVSREEGPVAVDLGDAEILDKKIGEYYNSIADINDLTVKSNEFIYSNVTMPLLKLIGDNKKVFISPDKIFNIMPFGALVDNNGKFLIENRSFILLNSGREILKFNDISVESQTGPVAFGYPDYGKDGEWPELKETEDEVHQIQTLFSNLTCFTQKEASKRNLMHLNGPSILHIATHGFLQTDDKIMTDEWLRIYDDPLLHEGLVLAGANDFENGITPGRVTAYEIASLNLRGTKLVVLSACNTGVGTIEMGEGVYGLRRAFALAGAESQIVSLWKVDENFTVNFMKNFYEGILADKSRSEALRSAQLKCIKAGQRNPYYWAGFTLWGQWASIKDPKINNINNEKRNKTKEVIGAGGPRQISKIIWKFKSDGKPSGYPASGFGNIYFVTSSGNLYSINAKKGTLNWHINIGDTHSSPALAGRFIYIGNDSGFLYKIDAYTGQKELEQFKAGGGIKSTLIFEDNVLYFGCSDGYLYSVDINDMKKLWAFETENGTLSKDLPSFTGKDASSPVIVKDKIYCCGMDGLYSLNKNSGKLLWKFKSEYDAPVEPLFYGTSICFSSFDNFIYAIDCDTGKLKWKTMIDSKNIFGIAPYLKNCGNLIVYSLDDIIVALNAETGEKKWKIDVDNPSTPLILNNILYFCDEKEVNILDINSGKINRFEIKCEANSSPFIVDGFLYLYSSNDYLVALE